METDIMVTIGLPVYNAERYLKFAIDSVLGQTYRNFELIISLDGSTDGSGAIAELYTDSRIHLIKDEENRGIAYRINQQVTMARGRYFARMDSDDIMHPERIEKQVQFMIENPDVDVIGSQAIVVNDQNDIIGLRLTDINFSRFTVLHQTLFIHPTVLGKTSWFRSNSYTSEFDGVEDYYLWNTTFSHSTFCVLPDPLLFYRDPPEKNIRTYLLRQRQYRNALTKLLSSTIITRRKCILMSVLSIFKSIVYRTAYILGISKLLIRRRNISLTSEQIIQYSDVLNKIIYNK